MHFHREKRRPVWGFGRAWRPLTLGNDETHRNTNGHSTARHSALSWFAYFAVKLRLYAVWARGWLFLRPKFRFHPILRAFLLSESKLYYYFRNPNGEFGPKADSYENPLLMVHPCLALRVV